MIKDIRGEQPRKGFEFSGPTFADFAHRKGVDYDPGSRYYETTFGLNDDRFILSGVLRALELRNTYPGIPRVDCGLVLCTKGALVFGSRSNYSTYHIGDQRQRSHIRPWGNLTHPSKPSNVITIGENYTDPSGVSLGVANSILMPANYRDIVDMNGAERLGSSAPYPIERLDKRPLTLYGALLLQHNTPSNFPAAALPVN